MTHPIYQDRTCAENLRRRYWISIPSSVFDDIPRSPLIDRLISRELEKNLIGLGFREDRETHALNYKSTDLTKILRVYKQTEEILGNNGFSKAIRINTQPLCRRCGALLKFSSKVCGECGSSNIEHSGVFDVKSERIIFKREVAR